jgi:hypothetical protein
MKRLRSLFYSFALLLSMVAVSGGALAQGAADQVAAGLQRGDASVVARYFGDLVDVTISKKQNNYSPAQAEMVLRDWLGKNAPSKYEPEHSGTSSGNTVHFHIGQLTTTTGKFRVYLLFKTRNGDQRLSEIRLEKL